jgi:predicted ATP-grasp superfamily ATP-dependent carboligase
MIIGFDGWMDGGDVSTGVIEHLAKEFDCTVLAELEPDDFYVYNVPGSMEISALFRPQAKIEDGMVLSISEPSNTFFYNSNENLILLRGKEPQIHWRQYTNCIFEIAEKFDVEEIIFIGSVTSLAPHTRDPIFYSSVSEESMKAYIDLTDANATYYDGPSSFASFMISMARKKQLRMMSLVAGIPPYVQGKNDRCIESAIEKLVAITKLPVDMSILNTLTENFVSELNAIVAKRPDLAEQIAKLEKVYDEQMGDGLDGDDEIELFQKDSDDIKDWFENQGFKID